MNKGLEAYMDKWPDNSSWTVKEVRFKRTSNDPRFPDPTGTVNGGWEIEGPVRRYNSHPRIVVSKESDARMISAAPEMLQLLEEILNEDSFCGDYSVICQRIQDVVKKATESSKVGT